MKTLTLVISLVVVNLSMMAQNYIGLTQSKIIHTYGKPTEVGKNYISYIDEYEDGTNTYYFNEKGVCDVFVMSRNADYLKTYQKLLKKEFVKVDELSNQYRSKKMNFMAQLTQTNDEFQIRITTSESSSQSKELCMNEQ